MYSLEEIFLQAHEDRGSIKTKMSMGMSIINYGLKIKKFSSGIEILNCNRGGDYFKELSQREYKMVLENGWKNGALLVAMSNCQIKLDMIEEKMREEINTRKNDKYIQHLKTRREKILNKYTNLKQKLNHGKKEEYL
jgi:hypothetical protein